MLLSNRDVMDPKDAALLNPLQLAYVGDAVWEILVRQQLILKCFNVHHMHTECVRRVNAAAQAGYMALLRPCLNDVEMEIARRGRNAHARHPSPRNQAPEDYAESTSFEAVIGYLYLTGQKNRLAELYGLLSGAGGENVSKAPE